MPMKIITLLTDFGSFYPAQMKGAILSRIQEVTFVDIAHDIPSQDIRAGAFALLSSVRYFPSGTIHLAVVDPGVGTSRLGIIVESAGHLFVGSDNGLLLPAAKSLGTPKAYKIERKFDASPTFHGRDIFAPVAAMLARGEKPETFGPRLRPADLGFGSPTRTEDGIEAIVVYVDKFGNAILNMRSLPPFRPRLKGVWLRQARTYGESKRIEPLIIIGSHGFAEIAVNKGNAAEAFGLKAGDRITLEDYNCSE
jgi:S-adenosyl-L-methionine hydrolase (adenosine-forming)